MIAIDDTGTDLWTVAGVWEEFGVLEARFEAEFSTFPLKVEETPDLWPEEYVMARTPVTCHDHVEPMQWRHLKVFNKKCVIVCALPLGRRGDDSKAYLATPPLEGRSKQLVLTQGRGRGDRYSQSQVTVKALYVYPLSRSFRERLRS